MDPGNGLGRETAHAEVEITVKCRRIRRQVHKNPQKISASAKQQL